MKEKLWRLQNYDKKKSESLSKSLGVSKIISNLLVQRGIDSFNKSRNFFRPSLANLHDPFLMKDMKKAVDRISNAILQKQKILIYGDYDVDGTTSVAMLYSFLKKYAVSIDYYIPCRYSEGYGVSIKAIDYASENNFDLIIALDCGITATDQVKHAKSLNIDFIICDHHNPAKTVPNAVAILNPKQIDCTYPYNELSGCGVGFKLIQAYCIQNKIVFDEITGYLDLVAVSIAADIVPVTNENRILAYYGLKLINTQPRLSIKILLGDSLIDKTIEMSDLSFTIAPRINAAGRINHAKKAVEILIENDYSKLKQKAVDIENNNNLRKNLDRDITNEALEMLDNTKKTNIVYKKGWHKGVVGIVASRLIEKSYKPTIVFSEENGILTGSARSVRGFNIYEAISNCSQYCEKFGGHKYAAGLTVKKENIIKFINFFENEVASKITDDQLTPKVLIDLEIDINQIDTKLFRIIKQFSPFGPLNLNPIFVTKNIKHISQLKVIGKNKDHLSLIIKTNKSNIKCIAFGFANQFKKITNCEQVDICYSITNNTWRGVSNLQLNIVDIKLN